MAEVRPGLVLDAGALQLLGIEDLLRPDERHMLGVWQDAANRILWNAVITGVEPFDFVWARVVVDLHVRLWLVTQQLPRDAGRDEPWATGREALNATATLGRVIEELQGQIDRTMKGWGAFRRGLRDVDPVEGLQIGGRDGLRVVRGRGA